MNAKLGVGILLLVSILLAGPAQAPKVVVVFDKDAGMAQAMNQKIIEALDKDVGTTQATATTLTITGSNFVNDMYIREFQIANAHEDSSIDLNIPVFDNMDSMIEIEKENPIVEN